MKPLQVQITRQYKQQFQECGTVSTMCRPFAVATLIVCFVSPISSRVAHAQTERATATMVTLHPNGPEAFSNVAPLTPEQHQVLDEAMERLREAMVVRKGVVPPGPQAAVPSNNAQTFATAAEDFGPALPTPNALYIGRNRAYSIVGDGESTVAEPAIAQSGSNWLVTQNWSRGYSTNAGATFTAIPDDSGPSDAPFFCCDQDAVHDHGRDVSIWSEVFVDSLTAPTTAVVRLHVRAANNLSDACTYDINGGAGVLYDYPHLGLGNNFLYLTANTLTNGTWTAATVWRYNLDELATCSGSVAGSVFNWTGSVGQVVWVPARATTDTMYLVTIENGSQNRYFSWPENSNAISNTVLNVGSSNFGVATCKGGTSGNNWLADPLSTSAIGFQVRSAVGQDGTAGSPTEYLATYYSVNANGAARPQAYAAGTIVRTSDMTLLNTADIFNGTTCISYPDVTANSRGDLGLAVGFGGSSSGGAAAQSYVAISDDYSRAKRRGYFPSLSLCAAANDNPKRWGDYLTARVQEPVDVAFIAATFGDVSGAGKTHVCEFMRGRYAQAYLDRRAK
jgi:hypothetical protein